MTRRLIALESQSSRHQHGAFLGSFFNKTSKLSFEKFQQVPVTSLEPISDVTLPHKISNTHFFQRK